METQSPNYEVRLLDESSLNWFTDVAAVNMLRYELNRPELVNMRNIYHLANKGLRDKTAFVAYKNGEMCGAIAGLLSPNLFNPDILTLVEIFWYVPEEYRKTRIGYLLLKAFEECGNRLAHETTLSILPHSEVRIESLAKIGFNFEELSFRKKNYGGN